MNFKRSNKKTKTSKLSNYLKQNYNNNNLIYIFIICRNLPENPDPYNDNEIKSNNIQKEEIDDNFFEEDFQINFANVSKNTNSHNKNEEIAIESHSKNETKIYDKNRIKTKIENINTEIKNVQNYEDEKIIDDDDCFLEMVIFIFYFMKRFN